MSRALLVVVGLVQLLSVNVILDMRKMTTSAKVRYFKVSIFYLTFIPPAKEYPPNTCDITDIPEQGLLHTSVLVKMRYFSACIMCEVCGEILYEYIQLCC